MSELDGAHDDDELAAAEVDAILATADEQLLRYVRTAVDSSKALLEIMVGADTDPADSAAAIIETRIRLRELVRAIRKARALASKLRDVFLDEHCKMEEPDPNRVWLAR